MIDYDRSEKVVLTDQYTGQSEIFDTAEPDRQVAGTGCNTDFWYIRITII